jgi:hypothetical protein
MPHLSSTKKTVYELDRYELGQFISEFYDMPYCVLEGSDFPNNDSLLSYQVVAGDSYDQAVIAEWQQEDMRSQPRLYLILNDLCFQNYLTPGEYQIWVCW